MLKNCCTQTQKLGCVGSCECVKTGLLATQTGDHVVEHHKPGGGISSRTISLTATDAVNFTNFFAESGVAVFKIKQPDGTYLVNGANDCFSVSVHVTKTSAGATCS